VGSGTGLESLGVAEGVESVVGGGGAGVETSDHDDEGLGFVDKRVSKHHSEF